MSPTNRHKYKYFHSTVQRAKYRRQKFHFCRLPFDVRPRNVKLNLSNVLSKLPDKATRDDREKARENTIPLKPWFELVCDWTKRFFHV